MAEAEDVRSFDTDFFDRRNPSLASVLRHLSRDGQEISYLHDIFVTNLPILDLFNNTEF